jgi:hypothetical protein
MSNEFEPPLTFRNSREIDRSVSIPSHATSILPSLTSYYSTISATHISILNIPATSLMYE